MADKAAFKGVAKMFHSRYGQSFVSVCVGTAFLVLALATSSSVLSCKFILSFV